MKTINNKLFYRVKEAADFLNIHPESLRKGYILTGKLKAVKFQNRWWIPKDNIDKYFLDTISK
jgi:hypothetical protein